MSQEEKKLQDILKLLGQSKSEIEEWYNVQSKINSGLESYIDGIREVGELNDDIKTITKQINKIQKEGGKLSKEKIAFLEIERAKIIKNRDLLKEAIKDANKFSMASTAAFAGATSTSFASAAAAIAAAAAAAAALVAVLPDPTT
jgi:DNA repair exonuclease SbcCD ATPase subunit